MSTRNQWWSLAFTLWGWNCDGSPSIQLILQYRFLRKSFVIILFAAALFALAQPALAQQTSATLTGTVLDVSGAVVGDAMVTLKNNASGDLRSTASNGDGYFTFAAVPPEPTRSA